MIYIKIKENLTSIPLILFMLINRYIITETNKT